MSYLNTTPSFVFGDIPYDEVNECVTGVTELKFEAVTDPDQNANITLSGLVGVADALGNCNEMLNIDAELAVILLYITRTAVISLVPLVQLSLIGVPHRYSCSPNWSWVNVVDDMFTWTADTNGG